MLRIIFLQFVFLYSYNCCSQLNDCAKIFDLYKADSSRYSDLQSSSYCEGVIESYNKSIPTYFIPESNICNYWALEKNGIKIVEGDLDIAPNELYQRTLGFNYTTKLRVKNDLNLDFDSLQTVDSTWVELEDQEFAMIFNQCFDFFKNDSGKTIMIMNEDKVSKTVFSNLSGTEFTLKRSKERLAYHALTNGIELSEDDLMNKVIYLEIHFENYKNPKNVCLLRYSAYTVPIWLKNNP